MKHQPQQSSNFQYSNSYWNKELSSIDGVFHIRNSNQIGLVHPILSSRSFYSQLVTRPVFFSSVLENRQYLAIIAIVSLIYAFILNPSTYRH